MIPKKPAPAKAGVADFSDKIMRPNKCLERFRSKERAAVVLVPRRKRHHGRNHMLLRNSIATIALATALATGAGARAQDASKFPDWKGQWVGIGAAPDAPWDPGKPAGAGQQ